MCEQLLQAGAIILGKTSVSVSTSNPVVVVLANGFQELSFHKSATLHQNSAVHN